MHEVNRTYTVHAQTALQLAVREARKFRHSDVGTGHILLGLMTQEDGIAAEVLTGLGAEIGAVRQLIADQSKYSSGPDGTPLCHTDHKAEVIRLAGEIACKDGHAEAVTEHLLVGKIAREEDCAEIGTEHLLLAIVRTDCRAAIILRDLGLKAEVVEAAVVILSGRSQKKPDEAVPYFAGNSDRICRQLGQLFYRLLVSTGYSQPDMCRLVFSLAMSDPALVARLADQKCVEACCKAAVFNGRVAATLADLRATFKP